MKQIIKKNKDGKTYKINVVSNDDGIYSPALPGTIWMLSTDNQMYETTLTGTSASVSFSISQTPILQPYLGQEYGFQYLQSTNGNVYEVSLSGSTGDVSMSINQVPVFASVAEIVNYKSGFVLASDDGNYYSCYLSSSNTPATTSLVISQDSKRSQTIYS
jgi:hypothetical protein